jgi:hypothetical protein
MRLPLGLSRTRARVRAAAMNQLTKPRRPRQAIQPTNQAAQARPMVQLTTDISFCVLLGAHDQRKFFGGGGKNAELVRVLQGALQVPPVGPALKFAFCTRALGGLRESCYKLAEPWQRGEGERGCARTRAGRILWRGGGDMLPAVQW